MTAEQLAKGNEIQNKIKELTEQLIKWQEAEDFAEIQIWGNRGRMRVEKEFLNFAEIKLLTIAKISKAIEDANAEFENL